MKRYYQLVDSMRTDKDLYDVRVSPGHTFYLASEADAEIAKRDEIIIKMKDVTTDLANAFELQIKKLIENGAVSQEYADVVNGLLSTIKEQMK